MATDRAASGLAIPRLRKQISFLSARVAELDAELAQLAARRPLGLATYVLAAVGLGALLFACFLCVGVLNYGFSGALNIDDTSWSGSPRGQEALVVFGLICLFGLALAVIAGAGVVWRGWDNENRRRVECETKKRQLTSERDSALAVLGRKQAELEHHRRVVAMEPGNGP